MRWRLEMKLGVIFTLYPPPPKPENPNGGQDDQRRDGGDVRGKVAGGKLSIVVHDVFNKRVVGSFDYPPRPLSARG